MEASGTAEIDYKDIARAAVDMAKYLDKVRPDAIALPLRSGCVTSKIVMEALRSNLGVPAYKYDPPMFPMTLIFTTKPYDVAKGQLARLEKLRGIYPIERLMIIDNTNWGISPSCYLAGTSSELTKFGEKVYVNLMASSDKDTQEKSLREKDLDIDKRFEFHFSRIKNWEIPFDDNSRLIGMGYDRKFNYAPYGFLSASSSEHLNKDMEPSQEFYKSIKKALNKRMWRDRYYIENRKGNPKHEIEETSLAEIKI